MLLLFPSHINLRAPTQTHLTGREGESSAKVQERAAVHVCMVLEGFIKACLGAVNMPSS